MLLVRKSTFIALLFALLVALFGAVQPALAVSDPGGPPSGDGVDPVYIAGNPSCATLNANNAAFPSITSDFGFKLNLVPVGTFTLTNPPGELTGGAPSDANNSVTISNKADGHFDWLATLGIDAVIVKGGSDADAYIYVPEDSGDTDLDAPINPNNGQPYGLSHVEFCYDYEPLVPLTAVKTAAGSYDRTITWSLEKSVIPVTHIGNVGESVGNSSWTVVATKTVTLGNYKVAGTITINNSNNVPANFSISDQLNDGTVAVVTCPGTGNNTGIVPANGSQTCSYTASPVGGDATENTATVTSTTDGIGGATAKAGVSFTAKTIGDENVTVDDNRDTESQFPKDISSTTTFDYNESFTCSSNPSDYTNGVDEDIYLNTATLTGDNTNLSDDAEVEVTCYAPIVEKSAEASHKQNYTWTIVKEADSSYSKFIGDPATTHNYTVSVDQNVDESFVVSGKITVHNPRPDAAMTVTLADVVNGTPATLNCGNSLNIPAGGSESCDYSVELSGAVDGKNIVTATFNQINFTASVDYVFGAPEVEGFAAINVTDTNGQAWKDVVRDDSWQYTKDFSCPTDKSLYVNGVYIAADHINTATIDETGQSDIATVKLTCYAPIVAKDAETEWQREYTWNIAKTVEPSSHSGIPGDNFTSTYNVTVDQTVTDSGFTAFGIISVKNPAGSPGAMAVVVADEVNGSVAVVDCDIQSEGNQNTLEVSSGETATCAYTITLPDATDRTNTATATFQKIEFPATALVDFGDPSVKGFPTINVSDFFDGALEGEDLGSASDDKTFTYSRPFECPTDEESYIEDFYTRSFPNIAEIDETEQQDDANVDVDCQLLPVLPASLGNFVWDDLDYDGVQDQGEPGVKDVPVKLYKVDNGQCTLDTGMSTKTNEDGYYLFENLMPGDYCVQFDISGVGEYVYTIKDSPTGNDETDSDPDPLNGRTPATNLTAGETDLKLDAGIALKKLDIVATPLCIKDAPYIRYTVTPNFPVGANPVTIRFLDATTNAVIDGAVYTGQPLAQDFLWHGAAVDPVTKVGMQWPGWKFENGVWIQVPTQLRPTVKVEFAVNPTNIVTLAYPPSNPTCSTDPRASLGNRVWFDLDKDGKQEAGENGVQGVKVTLFGDDNVQVGSPIFTDAQGEYLFTGLYPDTYYVVFDPTSLPTGFTLTVQNAGGSVEAEDSDPNAGGTTASVTLSAGQAYLDLDAGIVSPTPPALAALGDTVWLDLNKNGLQDFNEAGVPNVEVRLFGAGGTAVATQFTNANGKYLFDNLIPGTYFVVFVGPAGYSFTHYDVSSNAQDVSDSDGKAPSVDVSISTGGAEAKLGEPLSFTVFYTNTDPTLATTNLVITQTIPQGTTFVPGSSNANWSCTGNNPGDVCTLTLGSILPNAKGSVTFTLLLSTSAAAVPDVLDLIANLSNVELARTHTVELSAGETDLTVDAGLVVIATTFSLPTPTNPTNLPDDGQPHQVDQVFLPTVRCKP